jgi:hypothetical protein
MESLVGVLLHHFIGHGRSTALSSDFGRSSSLHRERLSTSSMLTNVHKKIDITPQNQKRDGRK